MSPAISQKSENSKRVKSNRDVPKSGPKSSSDKAEGVRLVIVFWIFLVAGVIAATFSPIQDCDEVFNYWEPSHYLNHGYGLQTWEYSPVYAIRSWAYAGIHSLIMTLSRSKDMQFYFLRNVFAFVCAGCQTKLFSVISRSMSPKIAMMFLIISVTSPGMFHASTAYLPSTFAMYTTMLGTAAFMDWKGGMRTAQGIMWFGIGATLGWPFAAALVAPFIAEELLVASMTNDAVSTFLRTLDGTVQSLIVLAIQTAVDAFFYRKLAVVPLNIVLYNVFGGSGKGPNIYGTEPWHFYIRNLILNFNLWFVLALVSLPLTLLQYAIRGQAPARQSVIRTVTFTLPFYLWLGIFTLQPHKEERFMYPAYPLLVLNAAISAHIVLSNLGSTTSKDFVSKVPVGIRVLVPAMFALAAITLGILRIVGMVTAYSAPLHIYSPLHKAGVTHPGDTVCLGKEWYRFSSSYMLPNGVKAKFIRSEFKGLLPGEFSEANTGFGLFPGAWLEPSGMNDENLEDPGKYTEIEHCTFLIDSHFENSQPTELEPAYVLDTETWAKVKCEPFLDAAKTSMIGRMLWVPDHAMVPARFRRTWGEYCLLRRKVR